MKTARLTALLLTAALLLGVCPLVLPASAAAAPAGNGSAAPDSLPALRVTMGEGYDRFMLKGGSKDTVYPHTTVALCEGDETVFLDTEAEIRGRGNFTWTLGKKPYRIKLSEKADLLGMGKGRKWVLLANHTDTTFMRNPLAFELADALGLPFTPDWRWVDLYLDDSYQGNYVLCEQIEVNARRVDLESEYGVLVELDNNYGSSEPIRFESAGSHCLFVLKDSAAGDEDSPDSKALDGFEFFRQKLRDFEEILYGPDPDYDRLCEYADMDSFIKMYFLQELAEDSDGLSSSFYLWMDGPDDVIHLGPVWDYDISFGNYENNPGRGSETEGDYILDRIYGYGRAREPASWYRVLWDMPAFDEAAHALYDAQIGPVLRRSFEIVIRFAAYPGLKESAVRNDEKYHLLGGPHVVGDDPRYYERTWIEEVQYLADWMDLRVAYLDSRYALHTPETQPETGPETEPVTQPPETSPPETEPPETRPSEPETDVPDPSIGPAAAPLPAGWPLTALWLTPADRPDVRLARRRVPAPASRPPQRAMPGNTPGFAASAWSSTPFACFAHARTLLSLPTGGETENGRRMA